MYWDAVYSAAISVHTAIGSGTIEHPSLHCWSDFFAKLLFVEQIHWWEQLQLALVWFEGTDWKSRNVGPTGLLPWRHICKHLKTACYLWQGQADVLPTKWKHQRYVLSGAAGSPGKRTGAQAWCLFLPQGAGNETASHPTVSGTAHLWQQE